MRFPTSNTMRSLISVNSWVFCIRCCPNASRKWHRRNWKISIGSTAFWNGSAWLWRNRIPICCVRWKFLMILPPCTTIIRCRETFSGTYDLLYRKIETVGRRQCDLAHRLHNLLTGNVPFVGTTIRPYARREAFRRCIRRAWRTALWPTVTLPAVNAPRRVSWKRPHYLATCTTRPQISSRLSTATKQLPHLAITTLSATTAANSCMRWVANFENYFSVERRWRGCFF